MAKTIGYGSVLVVNTSTGGEVNVAQVHSISGPGVSGNDVDTTTLDSSSNYRTFVAGLLDPGELTFGLVYDPTAVSHTRLARYMNARYSATWKVMQGSSGGTLTTFSGYIKGMSREVPMDDLITCDVTVKVSGKPGYTT
jgi:hypothetical protein